MSENREGSRPLSRHEKRVEQKKRVTSIAIIALEIVVLISIGCIFFHYFLLLQNKDFSEKKSKSERSAMEGTTPGSVNVKNDEFELTCNKVQIVRDVDGQPVGLIFFTFTNHLSEPFSMSDVFPPSVKQGGADLETFAVLEDAPDELYRRDLKISDGQSVECCYAVKLHDTMDTIQLTIHDNYRSFQDIGTVEIPLH